MKRAPNVLPEPGANGTFATHSWPAGNTAVPFYYGFDEQLAKTIAFLKAGNYLNVDLFALNKVDEEQDDRSAGVRTLFPDVGRNRPDPGRDTEREYWPFVDS